MCRRYAAGYEGDFNATGRVPITDPFWKVGLCPVNVHWHLGGDPKPTPNSLLLVPSCPYKVKTQRVKSIHQA